MGGVTLDRPSIRPTAFLYGGTPRTRDHIQRELIAFNLISTFRDASLIVVFESADEGVERRMHRIRTCRHENPGATILLLACGDRSDGAAIAAFRAGVTDCLQWPLERERLHMWCNRLTHAAPIGVVLLGSSHAMGRVRDNLRQLAAVNCRVLISGETGTGKEVAARTLHAWSRRRERPFVTINCPAVPETLFESELFGFERGAFSGAVHAYPGRLMEADTGSVFLDEVGELPLSVQAKLLRTIETGEIQRLGGRGSQRVDVRWIAATNRDLRTMMRAGKFRADLFYRLCVAETALPPLRDRKGDVAELTALHRHRFRGAGAVAERIHTFRHAGARTPSVAR